MSVDRDAHQRETITKWPIWLALTDLHDNAITCSNTEVYPGIAGERIALQHYWLHREHCSDLFEHRADSEQVLQDEH